MKSWAWALGASLALHLGLLMLFSFQPALPLPEGERVGERANTPRPAVFTAVSLVPRTNLNMLKEPEKPPAPAPVRAPHKAAPPVADELDAKAFERALTEGAVAQLGTATLEPAEGSSESAGSPGGEGPPSVLDSARTERGAGEPEVDVTALVHARLAAVADRCYPAAARRFQQRGTVELAFCTTSTGGADRTRVTQSSGAELLDAAALGCVLQQAAPFPQEAASRCFTVPVRFGAR